MKVESRTKIFSIISDHYQKSFHRKMSGVEKRESLQMLALAAEEKRLVFEELPGGDIGFFVLVQVEKMPENQEQVMLVSHCFCLNQPPLRRKFYACIKSKAAKYKKEHKIKSYAIEIYSDDLASKKYFSKKGKLTYKELVGKTRDGLNYLNKTKKETDPLLKITKIKKSDIKKIALLEYQSHLKDVSSRMVDFFRGPNGLTMIEGLYTHLHQKQTCFVLRKKNKIAGAVGYFIDEKKKRGLIASIFISNEFKGQGLSKVLYRLLLEEFQALHLSYYIGSSTTNRVLILSEKMGRVESKSCFLVKV